MSSTILVTGASQGIGLATSKAFAKAGWNVVMAARSAEKMTAEAEAIGARAIATDVSDPASVASLFQQIQVLYGRLEAVFNNAGTNVPPSDIGDLSFEGWRSVVSVNLDGAFLIASHAFKMMKEQNPQGGRIVNNGSISAHAPRPGSIAYTSTKHAITGMTKTMALDGRPYRIACGQIDIGNAETPMTAKMAEGVPQADGSMKPEPRMNVDHVGEAVLAMCSLPLESNVLFQTIMATNMPFVGRG